MIRNFTPATTLDRRRFMQAATGVLTGVLSALSPLAALVPSRSWALDMRTLSSNQAGTLLAMVRTMLPHDGLDDAAYALVVAALDGEAAGSTAARTQLNEGVALLGPDFPTLPEAARVATLKTIEQEAFFQSVRRTALLVLYANPIAYAHFGYEGEAFSKGGYLYRGFNDLKWLPDVPLEASGPVPGK
jgi:hypothetical protein